MSSSPERSSGNAVLGLVLVDRAGQLGMALAQVPHGGDDEADGGAGKGADHHAAVHGLPLGRQLRLGGVELGEHPLGAVHQPERRGREPYAPPVTLQQHDPNLALELRK